MSIDIDEIHEIEGIDRQTRLIKQMNLKDMTVNSRHAKQLQVKSREMVFVMKLPVHLQAETLTTEVLPS